VPCPSWFGASACAGSRHSFPDEKPYITAHVPIHLAGSVCGNWYLVYGLPREDAFALNARITDDKALVFCGPRKYM
jgi:hypothetical protein